MKYEAIRSEGGLISYDLLDQIARGETDGQKAPDFGLPKGRRLMDEISRVWSDAQHYWAIFKSRWDSLPDRDSYGTTLTRERWIIPLLSDSELFAYQLNLQPSGLERDGRNYPISHRGGKEQDSPPVHIEGFKIDLNHKAPRLRVSPHSMMQTFLNVSEEDLWAVVTNGSQLRLLRDASHTSRPTYLEFDLRSIFEGNRFHEFALFYRLCHRTRLPQPGEDPHRCLLEDYFQLSIEQGGRVRDHLRDGVEKALRQLGNAFLHHPRNEGLRNKLKSGGLSPADYHRQLLRLVYRLLFLMVAEERRKNARTKEEHEQAILGMKVCDPASGSGHFLLAAARRMGRELARIRSEEEEPTPQEFHLAVRDVIAHCIYAVDVNPLAVDLCKLALWLEGHWTGKPLSFLDHRVKWGNSLLGVLDPKVLEEGIPDDAFKPVTGDDKKVASAIKKLNRQERNRPQRYLDFGEEKREKLGEYTETLRSMGDIHEDTPQDVKRKADLYLRVRENREAWLAERVANLWTSAFFWPLTNADRTSNPTTEQFLDYSTRRSGHAQLVAKADELAARHHFFHWHLEFPEVFADGGFDAVLGNPPWERIKLQEQEFFATRDPKITEAPNKAARQKLIDTLAEKNPALAREFGEAKHAAEAGSKFVRASSRFPLTSVGDVNTYALFAGLARSLLSPRGRTGIVVPTGVATDDTCKRFFGSLNEKRSLVSLFDFENREGLFAGVHRSYKFCLLTVSTHPIAESEFAFFLTHPSQLQDKRRRFTLTPEDLQLLNPNTRTCPVFRTRADAELTKKIYGRVPVLLNERTEENPWSVKFMAMFHMANDSGLFKTALGEGLLPLYEGKMVQAFDHRAASVITNPENLMRTGQPVETTLSQHLEPNYIPQPRYWVGLQEVEKKLSKWPHKWLIGVKDVTSATNERTAIFGVLPRVATGHKIPLLLIDPPTFPLTTFFVANLNSLVFDYVARNKVGGNSMGYFILKQLPVLPPDIYGADEMSFIVGRVLELIYTAWDIKPFADDLWLTPDDKLRELIEKQWSSNKTGTDGHFFEPPEWVHITKDAIPLPPFKWDENRRAQLRAELDAYYAHLYGLTRDEVRYILDPKDVYGEDFPSETFRGLKGKEIKRFGEYRTRRLVLEAYDELAKTDRFVGEKRESTIEAPKGRAMVSVNPHG